MIYLVALLIGAVLGDQVGTINFIQTDSVCKVGGSAFVGKGYVLGACSAINSSSAQKFTSCAQGSDGEVTYTLSTYMMPDCSGAANTTTITAQSCKPPNDLYWLSCSDHVDSWNDFETFSLHSK